MPSTDFYSEDPAGLAALPQVNEYDIEEEQRRAQEMLIGAIAGVLLTFFALVAWVWVGVV